MGLDWTLRRAGKVWRLTLNEAIIAQRLPLVLANCCENFPLFETSVVVYSGLDSLRVEEVII